MVKRKILAALVGSSGLFLPSISSAQSAEWSVATSYFRQLQGLKTEMMVSGPTQASYSETTGPRQVPIAQLAALVQTCRAASLSGAGATDPVGIETTQMFECLGPNAPDKSVSVKIVVAFRSKSVAKVDVAFGGQIYWPGPAPSGPAWKQWDKGLYDQYRATTLEFVNSLKASGPHRANTEPTRIELYSEEDDGVAISFDRLKSIVGLCEPTYSVAAKIPMKNGEPREGLKTYLKCDQRSSARSDLTLYAAFTNGAIDTVLVTTDFGYRIPPAIASLREK